MKKLISAYTLFLLLAVAVCAYAGAITYTYDNAGRLTKADYGGGKSITYTYDNAGNLLSRVIVGQTHTLTVAKSGAGSGTVTSSPAGIDCGTDCNEDYDHGTAVTLTATPDAGSTFTGWSGDTSDGQVTMDADKNCTATFTLNQHTLTVTKSGTGSGTVTSSPAGIDCGTDCNEDYDHGTAVTLTATPDAGSTFTGWSGDTSDGQVTMDADKNCTAEFTVTPCEGKAKSIAVDPDSLELKRETGGDVTVTVTGKGGCPVEGQKVKAIISEKGKELIKISPKEADTDENGEAAFTITAKKKTGKTTVIFKAGTLKAKVRVKVTK